MRTNTAQRVCARTKPGRNVNNETTNPTLPPAPRALFSRNVGRLLVLASLALLIIGANVYSEEYAQLMGSFRADLRASGLTWMWQVAFYVAAFTMVWRILLILRYRPEPLCPEPFLPWVTVVVPAYNEGSTVYMTLKSVAASEYPAHKLQIIAVDDGSKDDTWHWMSKAAAELGGRVELIRQPMNQGKRHALYAGFQRAKGDVFVTVDSDSIIEPLTLQHLVSPMQHDPMVGAVAGNVRILNMDEGLIPRMMETMFCWNFDFIRAGQSVFNAVLCTPGALSAYRARVLRPHLEGWLNQKFMGRTANIGEDRALSNIVMREGSYVRYARRAVVFTKVPVDYRGLCKMLLRWARSNIRETLVACTFTFRRFRETSALGARLNLLLHIYRLTFGDLIKLVAAAYLIYYPGLAVVSLIMAGAVGALFPVVVYLLRYRNLDFLWAFPYCMFLVPLVSWVTLYSLVTPQKNGWLTRGLAAPPEQRPASVAVGEPAVVPVGVPVPH